MNKIKTLMFLALISIGSSGCKAEWPCCEVTASTTVVAPVVETVPVATVTATTTTPVIDQVEPKSIPKINRKDWYPAVMPVLEEADTYSVLQNYFFITTLETLLEGDEIVGSGRKGRITTVLPNGEKLDLQVTYLHFNNAVRAYALGKAIYANTNTSLIRWSDHVKNWVGMTNRLSEPAFIAGSETKQTERAEAGVY